MSKAFSFFYDYLLPELPGCTTAFVDLHLRQVARDFCEKTAAWAEAFPAMTSEAGRLAYFLITADPNGELVRVTELRVGGVLWWQAIEPREPLLNAQVASPRFQAHRPPFSIDMARDQITLLEQPTGEIAITGAMRPKMTATSLPDVLFTQYMEAIRMGVLSRLMLMPRKKWTDRDLAVEYGHRWDALVNLHAIEPATDRTRAPLRTRATKL